MQLEGLAVEDAFSDEPSTASSPQVLMSAGCKEERVEEQAAAHDVSAALAAEREEAAFAAMGGRKKATASRAVRKLDSMLDRLSMVEQAPLGARRPLCDASQSV